MTLEGIALREGNGHNAAQEIGKKTIQLQKYKKSVRSLLRRQIILTFAFVLLADPA